MKKTLADTLYMALRKHRDLERFMRDVAANSICMIPGFNRACDSIKYIEYVLTDETAIVFEQKERSYSKDPKDNTRVVFIKMVSGKKEGYRNVFMEGYDLNLMNIPQVA